MSKRASVDDCRLIRLPKHERENGNITVVENDIDLPFAVKRVYYLYDVPGGETGRYLCLHQFIRLIG